MDSLIVLDCSYFACDFNCLLLKVNTFLTFSSFKLRLYILFQVIQSKSMYEAVYVICVEFYLNSDKNSSWFNIVYTRLILELSHFNAPARSHYWTVQCAIDWHELRFMWHVMTWSQVFICEYHHDITLCGLIQRALFAIFWFISQTDNNWNKQQIQWIKRTNERDLFKKCKV